MIKQLASEELQREKDKMQEWKKNVIQEVGCKLQIIKQMYEGSIEVQKRNFQVELENKRGKVEKLEAEVQALKKAPSGNPISKKSAAELAAPPSSNSQRQQVRD